MCNLFCINFIVKNLDPDEIRGKDVLEVGACHFNGTIRPHVKSFKPGKYVGIDIKDGEGVDEVCDAHDMLDKFGSESFDVVISTETLEHVRDWRKVISNAKNILRPNGLLLLTTRSFGTRYHAEPHDYWRYELDDMRTIFSDMEILRLEPDPGSPGVYLKVRRDVDFKEEDTKDIRLHSMISNKRVRSDSLGAKIIFLSKHYVKRLLSYILPRSVKDIIIKFTGDAYRRY